MDGMSHIIAKRTTKQGVLITAPKKGPAWTIIHREETLARLAVDHDLVVVLTRELDFLPP